MGAPGHRRERWRTARSAGPVTLRSRFARAARRMLPALLFGLVAALPAVAGRVPMPKIPPAKGAHCVRPVAWMLKNHMKLLMQLRYQAVHEGIRHRRESLPGCMNCHVSKLADGRYPSVNSPKFFCNACHDYVGVRIDCFSCHTNRPDAAFAPATQADEESVFAARPASEVAAAPGRPGGGASAATARPMRWRSLLRGAR